MMTAREKAGKAQIMKKMSEQGYPTYASLLDLFELNLTDDPKIVGYMVPGEGRIVVNETLDIDQVSVIVRHEILHEFLDHAKRAKTANIPMGELFNIAADFEISNLGYTDKDKNDVRRLRIGNTFTSGLVTEDHFPDLIDKSAEEIYNILAKESKPQLSRGFGGSVGDVVEKEAQSAKDMADQLKDKAKDLAKDTQDGGSLGSQQDQDGGQGRGTSDLEGQPENTNKRNKYDDEEYSKMSPEEKKKERARRRKEAAKKLAEQANKAIDEIDKILNEDPKKGQVFDTPEEAKEKAQRIAKIKEFLADVNNAVKVKSEAATQIVKERRNKAETNISKYHENSLNRFTQSLNRFIKNSVARGRADSWAKINKKYVNSGLLRPGTTSLGKNKVPLINVYFDRSGSWDSAKTEKGKQAVSTLNKYVVRKEINVKLYYFADYVTDHEFEGGGTYGQPILDHILKTQPDNIVILTDSDISDCKTPVEVPGAVWMLFYDGRSDNLMEHLKGRALTQYFDIDINED